MKNTLTYLSFVLCSLLLITSFVSRNNEEDFSNLIISRFSKMWISRPQEKVYMLTDKPYYSAGEDIWLKGFLVNATTHQPSTLSRFLYVELTNQSDSLISRIKIRRDSIGFTGNIKLKSDLPEGYYSLRAYTYWMQNASSDFFFYKRIYIGNSIVEDIRSTNVTKPKKGRKNQNPSSPNSDFDVQFFPESGVFLTNNLQNIAFKAIGSDGLSVEVTGKIFNYQNEEILSLTSSHKGMGKIILDPLPGTKYYVIVKSSGGQEKRFDLPISQNEGVALHLACYSGNIIYEVINHSNRPNKSLFLLVHSRGKVYVVSPITNPNGKIPESALPAGINAFSIIDSTGNTLCERLLFDWSIKQPNVNMECNKASYGKREPVELNLGIKSLSGKSCAGNFAISVTDSRTVLQDTLSDNIVSYLLLSSDIKGYIEEPASYFTGNPAKCRSNIDLLMLTQGWRRFSTSETTKGVYPEYRYYLEMGQSLTGKVTNILGKPSKKCDVIMLCAHNNVMRFTQTDSLGRYLFDGVDFPDSTSILIKANKKKAILDVEIIPDSNYFVKSSKRIPLPVLSQTKIPTEYLQQSKEKYNYEGGMHITLQEITVEAEKIRDTPANQYYSGMGDNQVSRKDLERLNGMTILSVISTLPGVLVQGYKISIRGSEYDPLILIDGLECMVEDIIYLPTYEVQNIELFKGPSASIFGTRGGSGVIAITLRTGIEFNAASKVSISLARLLPLGYQKPSQFYTPRYEVDSIRRSSIPDLRTTIYWNPGLKTDSAGVMHVKFFTADPSNNYQVVLEGITDEGEMCSYRGIINRE